jgi:hypothetical protein
MSILDGWAVMVSRFSRFKHVVPMNDYREHDMVRECWCNPEVDDEADCITHRALDRRDHYEHLPLQ